MSFHHTHLFILAAVDCGMEGGSSKGDVEALRISTFLDRSSVSIMMTIMVMVVMMIYVMKWKLIRFVFFGNENIGETFQYDDLKNISKHVRLSLPGRQVWWWQFWG